MGSILAEHLVTAGCALPAAEPTGAAHRLSLGAAGKFMAAPFADRARPAANQPSHVACALRARLDCRI
ncbi:MAG TPA: hypothetical protein VL498_05140 [Terracidiphilus sp.]|nr:hypothetical protein [Terracidiphilus sp.]